MRSRGVCFAKAFAANLAQLPAVLQSGVERLRDQDLVETA
jgi:hypothetical protein